MIIKLVIKSCVAVAKVRYCLAKNISRSFGCKSQRWDGCIGALTRISKLLNIKVLTYQEMPSIVAKTVC